MARRLRCHGRPNQMLPISPTADARPQFHEASHAAGLAGRAVAVDDEQRIGRGGAFLKPGARRGLVGKRPVREVVPDAIRIVALAADLEDAGRVASRIDRLQHDVRSVQDGTGHPVPGPRRHLAVTDRPATGSTLPLAFAHADDHLRLLLCSCDRGPGGR